MDHKFQTTRRGCLRSFSISKRSKKSALRNYAPAPENEHKFRTRSTTTDSGGDEQTPTSAKNWEWLKSPENEWWEWFMERSDVRHVESVFIPRRTPDRTVALRRTILFIRNCFCLIARENWREPARWVMSRFSSRKFAPEKRMKSPNETFCWCRLLCVKILFHSSVFTCCSEQHSYGIESRTIGTVLRKAREKKSKNMTFVSHLRNLSSLYGSWESVRP